MHRRSKLAAEVESPMASSRMNLIGPPVKTRLMRQRGTSGRTIRLIDFDSLVRHLNSLPDGVEKNL